LKAIEGYYNWFMELENRNSYMRLEVWRRHGAILLCLQESGCKEERMKRLELLNSINLFLQMLKNKIKT
jgi:hypothetical protein